MISIAQPHFRNLLLEKEMKISSFEASLIRNIKFSMVIFLASIVCLNGHRSGDCNTNVGQIFRKCKNNRHTHVHLLTTKWTQKNREYSLFYYFTHYLETADVITLSNWPVTASLSFSCFWCSALYFTVYVCDCLSNLISRFLMSSLSR